MISQFTEEVIDKMKIIGIFGNTGSGKTALAFKLIEKLKKDEDIYVVANPRPDLILSLGYKNLQGIGQIQDLNNCTVYWDEPQLSLGVKEYKRSIIIAKICSLARQKGIRLIMSTSDTRVFLPVVESYIDTWIVKDLDYSMVKQRSKIKRIILKHCLIDPEFFSLAKEQFLLENRALNEFNGLHSLGLPKKWNEELSNAYGSIGKTA